MAGMKGSAGVWDLLRVPQQNSGMSSSSFPVQCSLYARKSVDATLGENGQPLVVSGRLILVLMLPCREGGRRSTVRRHCL